ncbi:hypothetical protein JWG39_06485 [Desulforhopalus vacuolatus]|uniref:hypothetical protein n=1 Tax=Desulforhopalus vacuolatus TaxID=40414 RepID=UPI00196595F0|nr:hypothetical protein [Desulforhopalus vacuolatus]MBM9519466.1 hypothetical protein [Desulforhopalus vacuolatus]
MKKVTAFALSVLLLASVSFAVAKDTDSEATDAMEVVAQPVEVIETQAVEAVDQYGDTVEDVEAVDQDGDTVEDVEAVDQYGDTIEDVEETVVPAEAE